MILSIRKKIRLIVSALLFIFLQTYSVEVYALTSGPGQEEYASFEPIGTTDMVNLYSGDFTYNIPLLTVPGPNGGYPINLAYHSGIGMDQEASWVGLGWNVNVGAINRNLRGLPDDFNGDEVKHEQHMRESWTVGLGIFQNSEERFGVKTDPEAILTHNSTLQIYYNNYKGVGYRVKYSPTFTAGPVTLGLSMSYDPHEGIGVSTDVGVSASFNKNIKASLGVSGSWNSRQGLQGVSVTGNISKNSNKNPSGSRYGVSLSSGVTFNFRQGVPAVNMPMDNTFFTTDLKMAFSADNMSTPGSFNSRFPLNWIGNYSQSKVLGNGIMISKAYGYMNSENATEYDLKDFSYTPISYNNKLPYLSPSNVTNDVFGITGQGTGGAFRGYRADIGVFSQKKVTSITAQHRLSVDVGVTPTPNNAASCPITYHIGLGGIPPTIGVSHDWTGEWEAGLGAVSALKNFKNPTDYTHLYDKEVKFYRAVGDRPAMLGTSSMYDVWKQEKPIKLDISDYSTVDINVQGVSGGITTTASDFAERTSRTPRTRVIQSLTNSESKDYGLTNSYQYYNASGNLIGKFPNINKEHHTSEISILEPDGMRYTYGLPAYNNIQEDVSFSSVESNQSSTYIPNSTVPIVKAAPTDPEYLQARGGWSKQPEFFDKTTLPAYVHSWMLTSVVSADYVDLTGDGLSQDDLGYWVDFKYQKTSDAYRWRAPYENAVYTPGTSQDYDNKGSYTEGTKELFYLKEIRTKTHIAIYELEDRNDAIAASDQDNGGIPSSIQAADRMKKLKSIKLYTIDEYDENNPQFSEPLKTVHFKYKAENDALCKGIPNHATNGGKLTLDKVYFTYGKSNKGALSPYVFNYSSNNPDYELKNHDCWGNYQDNSINNYPYHQFPYTDQSTDPNTPYQAPWHLTSIELPTGGTLNVEYEQDDYAYVEAEKAMQLYDIVHTGSISDFNALTTNTLSQRGTDVNAAKTSSLRNLDHDEGNNNFINPDFRYRIYFPLKTPVSDATNIFQAASWLKKHYIGDTEELYFKSAVKLLDDLTGTTIKRNSQKVDFVGGYAKIKTESPVTHYGLAKSPNAPSQMYDMGYITVYPTHINAFGAGKDVIHPIRDAAFQHLRFTRPELVNGTQSVNGIIGLFSIIPDIMDHMMGYKYSYKVRDWCAEIFLDGFSQIRLLVPDGKKLGGGVRVKKLTITDNWTSMTGGASSDYQDNVYGQIYDYTTEENGETISSGVAYEPFAGKEQNPLVKPLRYQHSNPTQSPDNLFLEEPIMMRHYPGASVGYRKVTVKSITSEDSNHKRSRTPYTEYNFYTPKDFPVEVKETSMSKTGAHYDVLPIPGIYTKYKRAEAASQGYTIIFNDMAGKMKSVIQRTHPDLSNNYEGEIISKQEYEYYTDSEGKLLNEVDVFTEDGKYQKAKLGIDYDIHLEMNEQKQSAINFTLDLNFDSGIITVTPPGPVCIPFPMIASGGVSTTSSSLKTAVIQKIISKSGILKSTTVTNQNSTITTENLVFDKMTGEPLLTKTKNEFKDDIYAYNQKAYWEYDNMAEAFKNTGAILTGTYNLENSGTWEGTYNINNVGSLSELPLVEGDEVFVEDGDLTAGVRATVVTISNAASNHYVGFAKQDGTLLDETTIGKITVVRSGRRNLLNAPSGAIAAMDFGYQSNPTIGVSQDLVLDQNEKILNATASTYRDYWPSNKNCQIVDYCEESACIQLPYPTINATNFAQKVDDGSIILNLNGAPLTSNEITVDGNCTDINTVMYTTCTNTANANYTVQITRANNAVETPAFTTTGTGNCTAPSTGFLTIPCDFEQSYNELGVGGNHEIRITGGILANALWPLSDITQTTDCLYVLGEFLLKSGSSTSSHLRTDIRCMEYGANSYEHDVVDYYFDWQVPNSNISVHQPWSNLAFRGVFNNWNVSPEANLISRLRTMTGKDWKVYVQDIKAWMPENEALEMNSASLGLLPKRKIGGPFGTLTPYTHCSNSTDPGPEMWYEFSFDETKNYHGFEISGLNPGTYYTIVYQTTSGNQISSTSGYASSTTPIQYLETQIALPANETVDIRIYNAAGVLVKEELQVTTGPPANNGVQVTFPKLPIGTNTLEVYYDNSTGHALYETKTFSCDANNTSSSGLLCADGSSQDIIYPLYNAYQQGTKGRWRPWASYTYVSNRYYGNTSNSSPSIREKGVFEEFSPFSWINSDNNSSKWQWATRGTKYAPDGYGLETVDALGNYSAALYDYNDDLATAVASNARYNEILFDGFENYPKECNTHTYLTNNQDIAATESHTGTSSYKIVRNSDQEFQPIVLGGVNEEACAQKLEDLNMGYSKQDILDFLREGRETAGMNIPKIMRTTTTTGDNSMTEPLPAECDCIGKFAPEKGKKYHISLWMKRDISAYLVTYGNFYLHINFKDGAGNFLSAPVVLTPKGSIIEEWQRITGDFTVPEDAVTMSISFRNRNSGTSVENNTDVYLDDLRILPYEATMTSYVYDKNTLRNIATLDDNNFATFYIYNEQGKLIKTKKETLEGVKTINEGRQHVRRNPNL